MNFRSFKKYCLFSLAVICCVVSGLSLAEEVDASDSFGLAVNPPYSDLELTSDESCEFIIEVENTNSFDIYVMPSVRDLIIVDNQPQFVSLKDSEFPLSPFVKFSIKPVLVRQGDVADFTFEIEPFGEGARKFLFGAVFFTASKVDDVKTSQKLSSDVFFHPSLGSIVLVSLSDRFEDGYSKKGSIINFSADEKVHFSGLVKFNLDYENIGTTFYVPEGMVEVKNWRGKIVDTGFIEGHFIFPAESQAYDFAWPYEQRLIGLYDVHVEMTDGEGIIDAKSIRILVVNMRNTVIFLLVLVVFFLTLYLFVKYKWKRKKK